MVPELEKPRVTEIQVRMDCNGCVQKIKKALHGIHGIYDIYIDFPQQKLTIIGWADPEKIVKAIKKTRKTAAICSHTEPTDPPAQPMEPSPEGGAPAPESANPPPAEAPPADAAPPAELPKDPPLTENPPPEATPAAAAAHATANQPIQPSATKDVEEVHVIYHHQPDYGYRYGYAHNIHEYGRHANNFSGGPGFRHEPSPPVYVAHSYNAYKPSPYVTGYEYIRPPPQHAYLNRPEPPQYTHYIRPEPPQYANYSRPEHYTEDYHNGSNSNGNITSMFSDENPNACRIV
ncbi:hypothetical protein RJ639_042474 [Escallonia herrerae]|uniref:HMA domain-containing protein n=1 Tax=Escallonia herrerae TaxID=1293975 RepID=A0AA89B368_9ASTE|nr:hypothetical protein RJ639_042474 [Escallonia herrerae]